MFNDAVSAVCKRCGKSAKSNEFVLDNEYRMMVCPACIKEKREKFRNAQKQAQEQVEKAKVQEEMKKKPAGWDPEDEYLEKFYKKQEKIKVERISDDKVKIPCSKCQYKFAYSISKETPKICPFCSTPVDPRILKYAQF